MDDLFLFTTEICYIFGQDNVVADAPPRIKAITAQVNHDGIAASEVGEDEVRTLLDWNTTPRLVKVSRQHIPAILRHIRRKCSVVHTSTSTKAGIRFLAQSVIPRNERTAELLAQRFVRPGTQDCLSRAPDNQRCQQSKVFRHTVTPLGDFRPLGIRFLHNQVGITETLPTSAGFT